MVHNHELNLIELQINTNLTFLEQISFYLSQQTPECVEFPYMSLLLNHFEEIVCEIKEVQNTYVCKILIYSTIIALYY